MRRIVSLLAGFFLALFLLLPAEAQDIVYDARMGEAYGNALRGDMALSLYRIRGARRRTTEALNEPGTVAVEMYDFQAAALMENRRTDFLWYPQYAVTMVLAVADNAPFPVHDWKDLEGKRISVGIPTDPVARELSVMAFSYGLSGQLKRSYGIQALTRMEKAGRLRLDTTYGETYFNQTRHRDWADVYITTDAQARRWIAMGVPVRIVYPESGTLSFRKGLLAKTMLPINQGAVEGALDLAGYSRYPTGRTLSAAEVEPFNREIGDVGHDLKYRVLYPHTISNFISYPAFLPYVLMMMLTILWGNRMRERLMGKEAGRLILLMMVVALLWLAVRTVGLILPVGYVTATRYIWYSYYLFMGLMMPLIIFLGLSGGDDLGKAHFPEWSEGLAAVDILLSVLVMTNDLHHFMFSFPAGLDAAADIHTYEPGYYILTGINIIQLLVVMACLCARVVKGHVVNRTFFLPVLVLLAYIVYGVSYAMGYGVSKFTEFTLVTLFAFLLWMETLLDSHMLYGNTGYGDFFTYSHLSMEIRDVDGHVVYRSSNRPAAGKENIETRIMPIQGGDVVWWRDVTELREKKRELALVSAALNRTHELLKKEEDIRRAYARLSTERKTFRELEDIVKVKGAQILHHARFLRTAEPGNAADNSVFRLNVLSSYVKKRCVMYLRGEEDGRLDPRELRLSMEELFRYLKPLGLHCLLYFQLEDPMPTEAALSLYDFLEELVEDAVIAGEIHLVCHVEKEENRYALKVLADHHNWVHAFLAERKEDPRMQKESLTMRVKDLDYAYSVEIEWKSVAPKSVNP